MSSKNEPRPSKAERTAKAREAAKVIREAQLKKEKRNAWLIRGGVLLAAVAIIVIIALVVINTQKSNEPVAATGNVPANANAYGGVTVGKGDVIVAPTTTETSVDSSTVVAPTAQATAVAEPGKIGIQASASGQPAQVVVYLDFMCPACQSFEQLYGPELDSMRNEGKITVEYRPLPFLDRYSSGTNYSSRSAAAAACVVDQSPDKYKTFLDSLYANQPAENSKGLDNAKLKKLATEAGAGDIGSCVDAKTFRPYVAYTGALGSSAGVNATPTVFVDGQQWMPETVKQFNTFLHTVVDAKK